jgi:iron complex outermembrane receptor protein
MPSEEGIMKKTFLLAALLLPLLSFAQQPVNPEKNQKIDSVVISAYRAGKNTPVSYTDITKEEMKASSPSASIPLLLKLQPSVISTNEGGTGLGYSKLRVRGSDATRINVTLNGVTLNDSESQEVFWVNLPALTGMLESIQIQRGVGTSVNGPGAFGASINMQTMLPNDRPYGDVEISGGSYSTGTIAVGLGSGRLDNGFSFDVRYAYNTTEGYIRNAFARLHSLYASAGWMKGDNSVKINYILGKQKTGITWEGIPRDMIESDRRYNPAGEYYDSEGNLQYYDNETDNYVQNHFQGIYSHQFTSSLYWTTTLNYTKGDGYYENYKDSKKLSLYGLTPQIINGVEYKKSDVIIQQALDNGYYVASSAVKYSKNDLSINSSVSYSYYNGDHFGILTWAENNANIPQDYCWYENNGKKNDVSSFVRGEYSFLHGKITLYGDMQYRHIDFRLSGIDKDFASLDKVLKYNFFNPKGGLSYSLNPNSQFYASLSVGHKEPSRSDIKEAIKGERSDGILPERLLDYEFGYRYEEGFFSFSLNGYLMEYKNQLVETGKLTETGHKIKENVAESYRRGVELSATWKSVSWLRFDANLALSKNKIKGYTAWVDTYNNANDWEPLSQTSEYYGLTNILMSPEVVGMGMVTFFPCKDFSFYISGKYVGKQYYDNTSNDERSLPAYITLSLQGQYVFGKIKFSIFADNLLNNKYISDAWVYRARFADGSADYIEDGFFPQAKLNVILKISYSF